MTKFFSTSTIVPIIAVVLCCILYASGYFQMILAALLLLLASYVEYKKGLFSALGFRRENLNVKSLLITAPLLSVVLFLIYTYVLLPSVTYLTGQSIDYSAFKEYEGNLPALAQIFVYMLFSAAFAEEIIFRGYLMRQFTKFFGSSKISLMINILVFGLVFAYCHSYQGITGQIVTGIVGMSIAVIFHMRKNDLWFVIALHGFIDTISLTYIYKGWFW